MFPNVILQDGGYGNIVFNIMFLLQLRLTKYFKGEDFNDVQFSQYLLKLYDMLMIQEHIIESPISYTTCLHDIIACVSELKFTKHGIRIAGCPSLKAKRAKSQERQLILDDMAKLR